MQNAAVAVPRFSVPSGSVMVRPPTAPPVPTHEPHALHGPYACVSWQFCNHCTKSTFPGRTSPFTLLSNMSGPVILGLQAGRLWVRPGQAPRGHAAPRETFPISHARGHQPLHPWNSSPKQRLKAHSSLCLLSIQDYVLNAQKLNSKSLLRRNEMCNVRRLKRSLCSLFPSAKVFTGCSVRPPGSLLS